MVSIVRSVMMRVERGRPGSGFYDIVSHMNGMGNDIFMGGTKFTPDFNNLGLSNEWYALSGGSGKLQMRLSFQPSLVRIQLL